MNVLKNLFGGSPDAGQLRYLSRAVQIEETMNPRLARATVLTLSLLIGALVTWSAFANINQIARANGEVVPLGNERSIQHLDGGVVDSILVREGESVRSGQALLRLRGFDVQKDLARAKERLWSLRVQRTRLRAYLEGKEPDFSDLGKSEHPRIVSARQTHDAMVRALNDRVTVSSNQLRQKRYEIDVLRTRLETAREQLAVLRRLEEQRRELAEKGHITRIALLETQQALSRRVGEVKVLATQIDHAVVTAEEFENRVTSIYSDDRSLTYQQLQEVETQIAETTELVEKLTSKVANLEIRAPVDGVVKGMNVTTLGGVIQPGASVLTLVPVNEALVVRVRISPKDVGHLKPGMPVNLRISSYDFGRYGSVPGRLTSISAASFSTNSSRRYFTGEIELLRTYAGNDPDANPITPGMTVSADIVTGWKTILEYMLQPIYAALSSAMSER